MNSVTLSISDGLLRILCIDTSGKIFTKEAPFDFDYESSASGKMIEDASANLIEIFKMTEELNHRDTISSGIIIGAEQTFLSTLPVDFDDEKANIDSHILWELSNYFPSTYKNFNIRYFRLNNFPSGPSDEILLLAIERKKIELLKQLFDASNIRIRNIEVDHFTVEKYLKDVYTVEMSAGRLLIIGCRKGRLDFSLLENGILKMYDYDVLDHMSHERSIINLINTANSMTGNIDSSYVYGDANYDPICKFIRENFHEITLLNDRENSDNHRFAALLGLALKNIEPKN